MVARRQVSAPMCRVYWGENSRELAPIARINTLSNYEQNPDFPTGSAELSEPLFIGSYYRIDLGYAIATAQIENFQNVNIPLFVVPGGVWVDGSTLNLYVDQTHSVASSVKVVASARTTVPVPITTHRYEFSFKPGFTVIEAESEGLRLRSPQISQVGNQTILESCRFRPGAEMFLFGSEAVIVGEPTSGIVTFDLSNSGLASINRLDFLGVSFTPSQSMHSPSLGEFFWNGSRRWATVFLANTQAAALRR